MLIIVVSFLFKDIKLIRGFNACGSLLSMMYGFITITYPTAILNLILLFINAIMFIKLINKENKIYEN